MIKSQWVLAGAFSTIIQISINLSAVAADAESCGGQLATLKKIVYVLDTNVFYADPGIIERMSDRYLVVPRSVIQELDRHKSEFTDRGQTSRTVSSEIRKLLVRANGADEIPLANGGYLAVTEVSDDFPFPGGLEKDKVDDRIVALARQIQNKNPDRTVVVLSGDNNVANLAFSVGLKADDVNTSLEPAAVKEMVDGPRVLSVGEENLLRIRRSKGIISLDDINEIGLGDLGLYENQYVLFDAEGELDRGLAGIHPDKALAQIWRFHEGRETGPSFYPVGIRGIKELVIQPRNVEQVVAADLLLNPHIKVVTLMGLAGTGKTLLTLAAGLAQTALFAGHGAYEKIIVTRPYQTTGAEMGFLPGDINDKMAPFMGPFKDNLAVIIEAMRKRADHFRGWHEGVIAKHHGREGKIVIENGVKSNNGNGKENGNGNGNGSGNGNGNGNGASKVLTFEDLISERIPVKDVVAKMMSSDLISIEPIAYSRGRTWNKTLLIVDEAQNLTLHEVRTLLTRVGEGTKVVLLGDIQQIDNRLLNHTNNGLVVAASRMRGLHFVGHMNLTIGERSEVATEAAIRLQPK